MNSVRHAGARSEQLAAPKAFHRGWSRDEIDRQFNLRARWPSYERYFERWAKSSKNARQRLRFVELPYGPTQAERLDLFLSDVEPAPLVAFVHGGYWQALDKSFFSYPATAYLARNIAYAPIGYGLAPHTRLVTMVHQVRRAVAWLKGNASKFGIDGSRMALVGHSAGGHLALMTIAADWEGITGSVRRRSQMRLQHLRYL